MKTLIESFRRRNYSNGACSILLNYELVDSIDIVAIE